MASPANSVSRPAVYVASPLGFAQPTRDFYRSRLLPAIGALEAEVLDPWSAPFDDMAVSVAMPPGAARAAALAAANAKHGAYNTQLLRKADGIFAVLDGPDVDSGTASEIGFGAGIDKPIVGWRSDLRLTGDNESATVNLQVQYFIEASGGAIYSQLHEALAALDAAIR